MHTGSCGIVSKRKNLTAGGLKIGLTAQEDGLHPHAEEISGLNFHAGGRMPITMRDRRFFMISLKVECAFRRPYCTLRSHKLVFDGVSGEEGVLVANGNLLPKHWPL
jgi:hypothetical protein